MTEKVCSLIAAATLSLTCFGSAQAQAGDGNAQGNRAGTMQLVKTCPSPQNGLGLPGNYCTIIRSSLPEIPPNTSPNGTPPPDGGSANIYMQSLLIVPFGSNVQTFLDSNVVLDAGNGNRAVGRCTFDGASNTGLCVYADGTGTLAGFSARLVVTPDPPGSLTTYTYFLTGPYVFKNTNEPPS